jgi:hypothetical protein
VDLDALEQNDGGAVMQLDSDGALQGTRGIARRLRDQLAVQHHFDPGVAGLDFDGVPVIIFG